ncbi:glyoxalase [Pseudotamlana agarivorans]|uniref:glyoxalase n=1 Tax=Pseudotamlana agarivorans TaxID=481183 RepID=UPI00082D9189|nr:glyoxalase [Tamlana agarivorans]
MSTRQSNLTNIRPEILGETINENMSTDERFQNLVLRPIIKLQNDLLVEVFKNYIRKHKSVFHEFTLEKRMAYIENAIQRDMKLRNSMKGMIIGQFTVEEYLVYIENSSALNKRMMNFVKERLLSQIQLFDNPEYLKAV